MERTRSSPIRKPLLGYYDESNPECVDWQIKWAVENGISCFLVDWYWVQGRQQLTHWFEAYRRAKYRDSLKVAIMWANHNPPGTHSAKDWLKVSAHWIERYFPLPGYYRIDGRPAVFIWDPHNLRNDLGGSQAVREVFDKSKEMARAAGFGGITLIALGYDFSEGHIRALKEEGYSGVTTYHEWGSTIDGQVGRKLFRYDDVVREGPAAWSRRNRAAAGLAYYPLVDTGWDSRPWHGHKSMVIQGRTPELFRRHLGCPPLRHHARLRLERARSLLANPYTTVSAVARGLGFADLNWFVRRFSRMYGMPPGRWRRAAG